MSKNLHLFTVSFPYGNSPEIGFIYPEVVQLSKAFDSITVYPSKKEGGVNIELPRNVKIVDLDIEQRHKVELNKIDYLRLLGLLLAELLYHPKMFFSTNKVKLIFSYLKSYYRGGVFLNKVWEDENVRPKQNDLLYSYWFADWNYMLSFAKKYGTINSKMISKAHGFDLYDERNQFGFIPFRSIQLKFTNAIFPISNMGQKYLKERFPKFQQKIRVAKLGTTDKGLCELIDGNQFTLVSCSSVSKVKRVYLIVEVLKLVNIEVKWVHFGGGKELSNIKKLSSDLPKNISVELKGQVHNGAVLQYYKENSVNLFINVSESEGIPVSIMEAISFSIPIVAPDVGGVSEIVNEKTGVLLSENFKLDDVSELFNSFDNHPIFEKEFRNGVRLFWEENYRSKKNHGRFVEQLKQM